MFQIVTKCDHFEWLDEYVLRITGQASIPVNGVATMELNLPDSVAPTVGEVGDLKGEKEDEQELEAAD